MMNKHKSLILGIDIGSVSMKFAVLDLDGNIIKTWYQRMKGETAAAVYQQFSQVLEEFTADRFKHVAITGSGGGLIGEILDIWIVNEVIAQTEATAALHPEVRTIIEIGGEDSKLIFLGDDHKAIADFAMNSVCAAGTGSFLDQQASRLGVSIEGEFGRLALKSQKPPRIAGRCSVFAKSDMIHLQQEATPDYDIVAGLCYAMARNFKSTLGRGKDFIKPVAFQGGVASNAGMVRAFKDLLDLNDGELIIPDYHLCMGAIGAALLARADEENKATALSGIEPLAEYLKKEIQKQKGPEPLSFFKDRWEEMTNAPSKTSKTNGGKVEAFLGIDVGSISTNVVVIDKNRNVLAKQYLMTAGRPIEAVRQGLETVGAEIGDCVEIVGVGTTGSGRYLIGDFVGADIVKNEITAQARAAAAIDPEVDTIFEIGGQDSKYISLENGVVVDFEMNKVCAAGTGSFLEEQAEKLGINIKEEFGRLALDAKNPVSLGERCTVFMESDIVHHKRRGANNDNLIAGLAYSIVYNYLNRVVQDRRVGKRIFFQGGVAFNSGVVAAFEKVTGQRITVPRHHEVTGALGAAIIAQEKMTWNRSRFKGFDLSKRNYTLEPFACKDCPNLCEIRKVVVENEEPLYYGSRCEKYNVKKVQHTRAGIPNLFKERWEFPEHSFSLNIILSGALFLASWVFVSFYQINRTRA
jgi:predicted CoA-substrate-specific enzyme activase